MEERMGFVSKVADSITKPEAYGYFIKQTVGKAIVYLILLTLIFESLNLVRPVIDYNTGINQLIRSFNMNMPDFELKNGELNVNGNMPIISGDVNYVVIVDTTGGTGENALDNYNAGILILKNKIIQKESSFQKKEYNLKDFGTLTIDKSDVKGWIPLLKVINVFIILFGYIGFFAGKLLSALILALIGLIISGSMKLRKDFGDLYKISIYSLTLPIIIKVLLSVIKYTIPYFFIIYYGIAVFYLWKALSIIKKNEETQLPEQMENM
jgi:hypothetical protein